MVRCAIIGLGKIGRVFTKAISECQGAVVSAGCDINSGSRDLFSKKNPDIPVFENVDELIREAEFDAAFVLTPDSCHAEPYIKCLDAGKHVFVEKPVGNSIEEIMEMLTVTRRNSSLVAASGHILRYYGINRKIKQMADAGEFGDIFYMEGDYIHNLLFQAAPKSFNPAMGYNWYLEDEMPMVGGGCHPLDVLRWFIDKPIISVYSAGNNIAFPEMKRHDCITSLFNFADGCVAKVTALYGPVAPYAYCNNIAVYGTKASVWRDQVCYDHETGWEPLQYEKYDEKHGHGFEREVEDFINAINVGSQVSTPVIDCAQSAIAAIMATKSLEAGKKMAMPEIIIPVQESIRKPVNAVGKTTAMTY